MDYIVAQVTPQVLEQLRLQSQGVSEVEVATDLTGIDSLPALKRVGGVEKVVLAPLSLIGAPVDDAVAECEAVAREGRAVITEVRAELGNLVELKEQVTTVLENVESSTANLEGVVERAEEAITDAVAAAAVCEEATEESRLQTERSRVQVEEFLQEARADIDSHISQSAIQINEFIQGAQSQIEGYISTAEGEFETLSDNLEGKVLQHIEESSQQISGFITDAQDAVDASLTEIGAATEDAREVASHPTYIGDDFYVYEWDPVNKAYNKTDRFVKGDPFTIKKVYTSVQDMEADFLNPEVVEGSFVLINTNDVQDPDNAKIYVKRSDGFHFLVDMSGAQGFKGKTPQLFFEGATGAAGSDVRISQSENGLDEEGNPKYSVIITIPRGDTGKPLIVLSNGNYGNWNEQAQQYEDSGVSASASVDLDDVPIEFTQAPQRQNISSGETIPVMLGKISRHFADLGALAFKGKVDYNTEIENAPQLAAVATSGVYADLTGKPDLKTVATTGRYEDLTGKPNLAAVATSGAYNDLSGRPALKTVATSGAYDDLTGKPDLSKKLDSQPDGENDLIAEDGKIDERYLPASGEIAGGIVPKLSIQSRAGEIMCILSNITDEEFSQLEEPEFVLLRNRRIRRDGNNTTNTFKGRGITAMDDKDTRFMPLASGTLLPFALNKPIQTHVFWTGEANAIKPIPAVADCLHRPGQASFSALKLFNRFVYFHEAASGNSTPANTIRILSYADWKAKGYTTAANLQWSYKVIGRDRERNKIAGSSSMVTRQFKITDSMVFEIALRYKLHGKTYYTNSCKFRLSFSSQSSTPSPTLKTKDNLPLGWT